MHARHKRHQHHGSHHKSGGSVPPHITQGGTSTHASGNAAHAHHRKHRAHGGRAHHADHDSGDHEHGPVNTGSETGQYGMKEPFLDHGNKNVVKAAEQTKSIGEVDGIYAHGRRDKRARGGRTA